MEHLDVIIVGAGISGISAAVHLGKACPERSVGILERRENIGGTWDLFKYPGIRSDSDMHTLGFSFKPWMAEKSIADGPSIMHYLDETVDEYRLRESIRFSHKVVAAEWCSADARWVLTVDQGEVQKQISSNFLFMCSGYYSYDQPYDAQIPGIESFSGDVVHPQFWPESLDYRGKQWQRFTSSHVSQWCRTSKRRWSWRSTASGASSSARAPRPSCGCRRAPSW